MTTVRPFRAVRYDPDRVDLSRVIVPPYDVIAGDERGWFYDRDPHNAIRLELTRDIADEAATDYRHVAATLADWRREGVLAREADDVFYVMRQRFTAPDGEQLERVGFFAELALADYAAGVVRPHERTLAGPKADRLKQMRATRANISSVFLLYEDREQELAPLLARALADAVLAGARDHTGVEYTLAAIRDPAEIAAIGAFLEPRPSVIADGHHRYETALAYRDEQRAAAGGAGGPWESTLACFANAYAPGSLLLPIHRVVLRGASPAGGEWRRRLTGWRHKSVPGISVETAAALLEEHLEPLAGRPAFAADDGSGTLELYWREEPLGEDLMVRLLESEVVGKVFELDGEAIRGGALSFPKSAERAAREVREEDGEVALYLNPLVPDDVFRATAAGEVMPQKSTLFYPKIPTGMVFRFHNPDL